MCLCIWQERVPDVGLDVGYLLEFLHKTADLSLNDIHIIGHSLGAHVAGFATKKLHGLIHRISGK